MPIIRFPASISAVQNPDGSIAEPELTGASIVRDAVLTLPFWKEGAELKRVDAFLEIEDSLEASPTSPSISIEARNLLKDAMQLRLPNGQYAGVNNPRYNRFYMRVLRQVLVASDD